MKYFFIILTFLTIDILAQNETKCLRSPIFLGVGDAPQNITSGDFNNDGFKDIAACNRGDVTYNSAVDSITVLLNTGDGVNFTKNNYLVGDTPEQITTADFNSDGNLDLALVTEGVWPVQFTSKLNVLFGSSSGTFSAPITYTIGGGPRTIVHGDFNGDGILDIVTDGYPNGFFLKGLGNGNFASAVQLIPDPPSQPTVIDYYLPDMIANDFNQDGKSDIARLSNGDFSDHLSVRLFGVGALAPIYIGANAYCLTAGDVNNDGRLDIVVGSEDMVTIVLGNSFGTFSDSALIPISLSGVFPMSIETHDINNDGNLDLVIADANDKIEFMIGDGNGNFLLYPYQYSTGNGSTVFTWEMTSGDFNNDGMLDFATVNENVDNIGILFGDTCNEVWPGDANSDGKVTNIDILELGLHYGQNSYSRNIANNNWIAAQAPEWTGVISNGKNLNHSDCNGDGTINNNDTLAIYNNYGLTHAFKQNNIEVTNPQLSIVPDQAMVTKGNWGSSSIYLGDVSNPISNINGIAFTVDFDNTLIETNSIYIEYENSFINTSNDNLHFRKLDFPNEKIFTATTHTNNINANGYGKIATLHYQVKSSLTTDEVLNVGLSQANQSDASGAIVPLTSGTATLMALGSSVGIQNPVNESLISISPNPATNELTVRSNTDIEKIEITNLTGQVVLCEQTNSRNQRLNLENVANGVYFVKVYNNSKQISVRKLVVNK